MMLHIIYIANCLQNTLILHCKIFTRVSKKFKNLKSKKYGNKLKMELKDYKQRERKLYTMNFKNLKFTRISSAASQPDCHKTRFH